MPQPNIMLVMTDQQRADFLKGQGFGLDTMPFLESLRPRGVWFDATYTSMPICTPARISLLTGRYAKTHQVIANWPGAVPRYGRDLPDVLAAEGYELALFGKNHSHVRPDQFDVWQEYNHTAGAPRPGKEAEDAAFDAWLTGVGHWVAPEPTPFPVEAQYPARIVSDALEWLAARQPDRPFFAWVSFPEPHSPYQVPEPYFSLFPPDTVPPPVAGPEALAHKNYQWQAQYRIIKHYHPRCDEAWPRYRATYCGMLRLIDDQLRRLIGGLEARGLLENTLVVFLSDHGDFCGDYGLYRKGLALPQVLIRTPMVWFGGPVRPYAGEHPAHVSITDVFPTLCAALGLDIPAGVQGRSLWPLLLGQPYSEAEFSSVYVEQGIGGRGLRPEAGLEFGAAADTVYIDGQARTNFDGTRTATAGYRRAVIRGRWKLVYEPDLPPELYDLQADPYELDNLANRPDAAAIQAEMVSELLYWSVRLDDNLAVKRYEVDRGPGNWQR